MRPSVRAFLAALALLFAVVPSAHAAVIVRQTLTVSDRERTYYLYVPDGAKTGKAPLLLLLHGSGGNGLGILSLWKDKADREGIVLAAPDAWRTDAWRPRDDTPHFIGAVIDDAAARTSIDFQRLYLFGQSGGAVYALVLSMIESKAFAATAIHAGSWRNAGDFKMIKLAARHIPIKIIVGDLDEYFSLASVHHTRDALTNAGFPVEVEVVAGQHHGFNDETAPAIDDSAWAFLRNKALDAPPVFADYGP